MRELRDIAVDLIDEPELAARVSMDEEKFYELVNSMRDLGLRSPIEVKPKGERFEVIAGHRRLRAARELEWKTIPAFVNDGDGVPFEAIKIAENAVRENVNPADEAVYLQELVDKYHLNEEQLIVLTHRNRQYIGDRLALLRGDQDIWQALHDRKITFGVARELNRIEKEETRRYYLAICERNCPSSDVAHGWMKQANLNDMAQGAPAVVADAPLPPAQVEKPFFGCDLCGGDRDPYNLVHVKLHRHEWETIRAAYLAPPKE